MKLRCNVCDDVIAEEECDVWCRAERCSLIMILSLMLFWMMSFWQVNYAVKAVFCEVSSAVMIIKQAFSIKFVNNSLSAAWESDVQKDDVLLSERLSKYNYVYIQQWGLCCCLFYATILFRMCTSSLLCKHFVSKFILRYLHFSCSIFFFIIFCFCISFQQSKYINSVTYSTHCILYWSSSCRLDLQNQLW